jgi:serine/threonine protein kinase
VERDSPYLVLDHSDAIPLPELCERAGGRLDPATVALVTLDVALALEHAHSVAPPVLHRGISPQVILVDARGSARLGGYVMTPLIAAISAVHSQVLELTCHYQSPELLKGAAAVPATDLFSLGATLYELLAGRPAFEAPTPLAATLKITMGSYARLETVVPEAPQELRDLAHQLLSTEPAGRPTARDVVDRLTSFLGRPEARRRELGAIVRPPPPPPPPRPAVPATDLEETNFLALDEKTEEHHGNRDLDLPPVGNPVPARLDDPEEFEPTKEVVLPDDFAPRQTAPAPSPFPADPVPVMGAHPSFGDVPDGVTAIDGGEVEKTRVLQAPHASGTLDALPSHASLEDAAWGVEKTVQIQTPVAGSPRLDRVTVPPSLPRASMPDLYAPPPKPPVDPMATGEVDTPSSTRGRPASGPSMGLLVAIGLGAIGLVVTVAALTAWLAS